MLAYKLFILNDKALHCNRMWFWKYTYFFIGHTEYRERDIIEIVISDYIFLLYTYTCIINFYLWRVLMDSLEEVCEQLF